MSGEILTAEQLAERWQVKVQHVYRMTRDGAIPCIPLPGKYRRLDEIEKFERGELDSDGECGVGWPHLHSGPRDA